MLSNIKFYFAIFELSILSAFLISIDIITLKSRSLDIPFFKELDIFPLYGMNYIAIYLFVIIHRCLAIHSKAKNYRYVDMLSMLKTHRYIELYVNKTQEQNLTRKYVACYLWITNKKCQKALHAFAICIALLAIMSLFTTPDIFFWLTCGAFVWGLVNLALGTLEVV